LLVRYVLMEFTNFNIGNLQYMYEQISSDLYASPKAYIITLTSAFLASRMNLLYSWEYHGIHIPALLALQWFEPLKIFSTFAEAGVVYLLAIVVLRLPYFRGRSFEGAQKVVLFFTIAFAYKIALGFFLLRYFPGVKISDYYGFGYMLATLMAVKSHDKGIGFRLARVTVQMSLVGAAVGSLIGFRPTFVPKPPGERTPAP